MANPQDARVVRSFRFRLKPSKAQHNRLSVEGVCHVH